MGTPRYLKVCLMSMISSVAVFAVTVSEPYVAVTTVALGIPINRCFVDKVETSS